MSTSPVPLPSPSETAGAPELVPLALLEFTVKLTTRSLLVAHPELSDSEPPATFAVPPSATLAYLLLRQLKSLSQLLPDYRYALILDWDRPQPSSPPDPDPF
jgi:hypothetical protein